MAQAYQSGINSGAEAGHPAQMPAVTADAGITEKANERPDIASNKDTSAHTDNKGDPSVPPNKSEVDAEMKDPDDEEGEVKPPPGVEYPEQKHAGKVGYGPAYAETHGAVGVSERFAGFKQEVKGKILRKPDVVEHGKEMMSGEAKKKELEKESQPMGAEAAGKKKAAAGPDTQVAKGAEEEKPVAEAAQKGAETKGETNAPVAKEVEQKTDAAKGQGQPDDISHTASSAAEKAEQNPLETSGSSGGTGDVKPNPPAPHKGMAS